MSCGWCCWDLFICIDVELACQAFPFELTVKMPVMIAQGVTFQQARSCIDPTGRLSWLLMGTRTVITRSLLLMEQLMGSKTRVTAEGAHATPD